MRRARFGTAAAGVALAAAAAAAFVLAPGAGGSPRANASCDAPKIVALGASTTATTATVSFSITSSDNGEYTVDISSPQTTKFTSSFSAPGGDFDENIGGLIPHTHYRGTLDVRNDCGSDSGLIDFRTIEAPPPPACTGPPGISNLQVGSIGTDAAVVGYSVASGDAANVHVTVSPGGADSSTTIQPPGGAGQVPLSGLTPNTAYTVTVTATNGCGPASQQTTFTTLRLTDCSKPPAIGSLRIGAVKATTASVRYAVVSDGAISTSLTVTPGGKEVDRRLAAPGGAGTVPLRGLKAATRYRVALTATNECGQVSDSETFVSLGRIAVAIVGAGRVTSAPGGISCTHACAGSFKAATTVLLVERAARGWHFLSWGGACDGSARVCKVNARNAHVTARFGRGS